MLLLLLHVPKFLCTNHTATTTPVYSSSLSLSPEQKDDFNKLHCDFKRVSKGFILNVSLGSKQTQKRA